MVSTHTDRPIPGPRPTARPGPALTGALGVLVAWPIAALLVPLGLTALFGPREEPRAHHWQTYEG